eukprot:scaffold1060_cov246-Pinguiococcus_pyrenoidosus.AAC.22
MERICVTRASRKQSDAQTSTSDDFHSLTRKRSPGRRGGKASSAFPDAAACGSSLGRTCVGFGVW